MSLTTVVDRTGVRWTKFNSVYTRLTGATSKNAARELQDKISEEHVREYRQLDLDVNQQIKAEQNKSKFINDVGLLEYVYCCNIPREAIDSILKDMNLTICTKEKVDTVLYNLKLSFHEDNIHIEDTFCMLRVFGIEIWIEVLKLCRYFEYANPWQAIQNHITDENKATTTDLLRSMVPQGLPQEQFRTVMSDISPNLLFINEAGLWQLSQHTSTPMLKRFWASMWKTLSKRLVLEAQLRTIKAKIQTRRFVLEAQLLESEAKIQTRRLECEKKELENRLIHMQSLYLYSVERNNIMGNLQTERQNKPT